METLTEPKLTQEEWRLVLELLEAECRELPREIHHTVTSQYKQRLRTRFDAADRLLHRLQEMELG